MLIYKYISLDISYNSDSYVKINDDIYYCNYEKSTIDKLVNVLNNYYKNFQYKNEFKIYLTGSFLSKSHAISRNIDLIVTKTNESIKDYDKIYDCLYFLTDNGLKNNNIIIKAEYYDNCNDISNHYLNLYNTYDFSNNLNTNKNIIDLFKSYGENLNYIYSIEHRCNEISGTDLFIIPNYNINIDLSYHILKYNNSIKKLYTLNFDASFNNKDFYYYYKDIIKFNSDISYSYNEHYFQPILLFDGINYNSNIFDYSNNILIYNNNYQPYPI